MNRVPRLSTSIASEPNSSKKKRVARNRVSTFGFIVPKENLEFNGERYVSALRGPIQHEHYHRYLLAARLTSDLDVLDVACGEGYGSRLIGDTARSVLGIDKQVSAVEFAQRNFAARNVSFQRADAIAIPLGPAAVDAVVSFETLEHFSEHELFMQEVKRVLRPGGLLLLSSPNRPFYRLHDNPNNPFHVQELDREELVQLLAPYFSHVRLLKQRAVCGSTVFAEERVQSGFEIYESADARHFTVGPEVFTPSYYVALASDKSLPSVRDSLLHDDSYLRLQSEKLQEAEAQRDASRSALHEVQLQVRKVDAQHEVARLRLHDLELQVQKIEAERDASQVALQDLRNKQAQLRQTLAEQVAQGDRLRATLLTQLREMTLMKAQLDGVFTSRSWRLTAPLRRTITLLRDAKVGLHNRFAHYLRWL